MPVRATCMFEAVRRRLVLAVDIEAVVDIVDTDPFGLEAAPRVTGRSVARLQPVHRRVEAPTADILVPNGQP